MKYVGYLLLAVVVFFAPATIQAQEKKVIKVQSEEELEKLKKQQEIEVNAKKEVNRGNELYSLGKYREALQSYQKSVSLDPGNANAYYGMGLCYQKMNQLDKALENFEKAIKIDNQYWKAYYAMGNTYLKINKFNEALNAFIAASKVEDDEKVYYQIAYTYVKMNNYAKAIPYYEKSIEKKPNYDLAWMNLSVAYLQVKNYKKAVETAQKALTYVKKSKDKEKVYYILGEAYFNLGNYDDAKDAYEQVTRLSNSGFYYGGAVFGLGMVYKKKGDLATAKKYFNQAKSNPSWRAKAEYELKN